MKIVKRTQKLHSPMNQLVLGKLCHAAFIIDKRTTENMERKKKTAAALLTDLNSF